MTTVIRPLRFEFQSRRKRATTAPVPLALAGGGTGGPDSPTATPGRVPRVAKLMALAIKFDGLLRDGTVSSQSELAALARVTQPRMTQIMNLLHLAPDIQAQILFLPQTPAGCDAIHEHMLRPVAACVHWERQRELWGNCQSSGGTLPKLNSTEN